MLLKRRFKFCQSLNIEARGSRFENEARQLRAAWSIVHENDKPMAPAIISNIGELKLSLSYYVSKAYFGQDLFVQHLSKDDTLEDLFYLNRKEGLLSPLMSAVMLGQTAVFYPSGGINQKVFAHLTPLFNAGGEFLSYETGLAVSVPDTCRFAVLLNEEDFQFQLSREQQHLLSPKIRIAYASAKDFQKYFIEKQGVYQKELLDYVMNLFDEEKMSMSLEEMRNVLTYSSKLYQGGKNSYEEAVEEAISVMKNDEKRVGESRFLKLGHD